MKPGNETRRPQSQEKEVIINLRKKPKPQSQEKEVIVENKDIDKHPQTHF